MKKIRLYLCLVLALLGVQASMAEEAQDAVRAATRRGETTTIASTRQTSSASQPNQTNATSSISRSTSATPTKQEQQIIRNRDETGEVVDRTAVKTSDSSSQVTNRQAQNVTVRSTSNVQSRVAAQPTRINVSRQSTTNQTTGSMTSRSANNVISVPSRAAIARTGVMPTNQSRISSASSVRNAASSGRISRIATTGLSEVQAVTAEDILNSNYQECREVYNNCMDEFCANKDSQLKRCACSSRVNEFDSVKQQLNEIEEKMLDFNQRLLTVNMDAEDAEALFEATEGELAFNKEDETDSKKLLDEIAEKLNASFDDENFNQSLNAINLSLNMDAAFDTVDPLLGASTTSKTGTALYNAALPVCREMALEICSQEELDIIESGYQMLIEQDCNTVAKAYETQQDQAREKIFESGALLDMARLDIYQKRNSDDILTCKKKMLDMLTDNSVCGDNLGKCLDTTGRYIDPSTGEAFLTVDLVNLGNLITRPAPDQTWTNTPGNEAFVSFLNSKKKFLEPAMENCQDISDYVWDEFIEDALAQIKLAQEQKLEDMRQSCTTLTTQCLTETADSIEDFDSRALSVFGVTADRTVKEICSGVQQACTALLETTGGDSDWIGGMTDIATDKTYDTILQTCREIGKNCMIQACKSISGNFGLCENVQNSINRKSIINRYSCWEEVVNCVVDAGQSAIDNVTARLVENKIIDSETGTFYKYLYGNEIDITITNTQEASNACSALAINQEDGTSQAFNCIYDICATECGYDSDTDSYGTKDSFSCKACRIAESLWGNCEVLPTTNLQSSKSHNRIKYTDSKKETLLYWFAKNTSTESRADSCRDTTCPIGYRAQTDENGNISCYSSSNFTDDGVMCPENFERIEITLEGLANNITNCCKKTTADGDVSGTLDFNGNCCKEESPKKVNNLNWETTTSYFRTGQTATTIPRGLCTPNAPNNLVAAAVVKDNAEYVDGTYFLICSGGETSFEDQGGAFPNGKTIRCAGEYVLVNKTTGQYIRPTTTNQSENYYLYYDSVPRCTLNFDTQEWESDQPETSCQIPNKWQVSYE